MALYLRDSLPDTQIRICLLRMIYKHNIPIAVMSRKCHMEIFKRQNQVRNTAIKNTLAEVEITLRYYLLLEQGSATF